MALIEPEESSCLYKRIYSINDKFKKAEQVWEISFPY
jgi:hypothetical protein